MLALKWQKIINSSYRITDGDIFVFDQISQEKKHYQDQQKYYGKKFSHHFSGQWQNWEESYLKRIFTNIPIKKNGFYLDIGSGSGYVVIEAAKRGVNGIGIDLSVEGVRKAKSFALQNKVDENSLFILAGAEKLPFKNEVFNGITLIMVLEHIIDDALAIKEIYRVLKPGGKVYITVPNTYRKIWPFLWPIYLWHDKKVGHLRHYSIGQLGEKFETEGFVLKKYFYTGHLIKLWQVFIGALFPKKDDWWWHFEEKDLRNTSQMAVNLIAVFEKKKNP